MKKTNNIKFEIDNGIPYLIYTLLDNENVDDLYKSMIINNEIDGLVPMVFSSFNNEKQIKYNITSLLALEDYVNTKLSKKQVIKIFKDICTILQNSEEYLLDKGLFNLDIRYIFMNKKKNSIMLVYVPTDTDNKLYNLKSDMRDIFFKIDVVDNDNSFMNEIRKYLGEDGEINVNEFLDLLNELDDAKIETEKVKPQIQNNKKSLKKELENAKAEMLKAQNNLDYEKASQLKHSEIPEIEKQINASSQNQIDEDYNNQIKEEKNKKTEDKGIFGLFKKKDNKEEVKQNNNYGFAIPGVDTTVGINQPDNNNNYEAVSNEAIEKKNIVKKEKEVNVKPQETMNTVFINNNDDYSGTVFKAEPSLSDDQLGLDQNVQEENTNYIYKLVNDKNNQSITISKKRFVFGALRGAADCCLDSQLVSGRHAQILKKEDGYYVEDLNSLNYTYLNDKRLNPKTPTLIKEGDVLKFADVEFRFVKE